MNDVINRKDAIGAILSVGHIAELSDGDAVIRVSTVNYVLRNLPSAQPAQRWIHVTERLPEKPEQVLIYAYNVHYVLAKYKEIRTWEGIYKMAWVMEDAYNAPHEIKHDVIAWMPLPEPYRKGEKDEADIRDKGE